MSNCLDRANVELEQLERDLENGTINEGEYLESCNALKASVDAYRNAARAREMSRLAAENARLRTQLAELVRLSALQQQ